MALSADIVNMMMYLQHGKSFPKKLKMSGVVNTASLIGYRDYTSRDAAKSESEKEQLSLDEGGYLSYTSREGAKEGQADKKTLSNMGWLDSPVKEKAFKDEVKKYFDTDGQLAWIPVTSFKDYLSAGQYGLFNENDYATVVSKALPQFFKRVGFEEDNMLWWMDYHSNKAHPHTHLVFLEKDKRRTNPLFTQKEIDLFKGLIIKEAFARQRILTNTADVGLNDFKNKDALWNNLMRSASEKINDRSISLVGNKIIRLYKDLPGTDGPSGNKRLQYNSSHMAPYRKSVDEIVDIILEHGDIKKEYEEFITACDALDTRRTEALTTVYHSIRDAEVKRLYSYLGNKILQGKKNFVVSDYPGEIYDEDVYPEEFRTPLNLFEIDEYDDEFSVPEDTERRTLFDDNIDYWNDDYKNAKEEIYSKDPNYELILKVLESECLKGNPMAMYDLAKLVENGHVSYNKTYDELYKDSLDRFVSLNEKSRSNYYMYRIGKMHQYGTGCELDIDKAKEYYNKSINYKYSKFSLANIAYKDNNYEEAYKLFTPVAVGGGIPFANYRIAEMIENKYIEGTKEDMKRHYEIAFQSFSFNDNRSEYVDSLLGDMYLYGKGTTKDCEKAYECYASAEKKGSQQTSYKAAELIHQGQVSKDDEIMQEHYKKAFSYYSGMNQSDISGLALYRMAKMNYESLGTNKNVDESIRCSVDSYDKGFLMAKYYLSNIYLNEGDISKGIETLQECVNDNNTFAINKLAMFYLKGDHVAKDREMAMRLIRLSASLGDTFAEDFMKKDMAWKSRGINREFKRFHTDGKTFAGGLITSALSQLSSSRQDIEKELEKNIDEYYEGEEFI